MKYQRHYTHIHAYNMFQFNIKSLCTAYIYIVLPFLLKCLFSSFLVYKNKKINAQMKNDLIEIYSAALRIKFNTLLSFASRQASRAK